MKHYLGDSCRELVASVRRRKFVVSSELADPRDAWRRMLRVEYVLERLWKILERIGMKEHSKPILFRWLLSQKLSEDDDGSDPVLPSSGRTNCGFMNYLKGKNIETSLISSIEKEFNATISGLGSLFFPSFPLTKDMVRVTKQNDNYLISCYSSLKFSSEKREFPLTAYRFERLQKLYQGPVDEFPLRLVLLLMRYDPVTRLCAGYSGGCTRHFFDTLQQETGVTWELFASPLNVTLDNYLSAYDDTDRCFGSRGSFLAAFETAISQGGSFEINPPFTEEHLSITTTMVLESLSRPSSVPLTFIYIHPTWTDLYGYNDLEKSSHLRAKLSFSPQKHYYESGRQYDPRSRGVSASSAGSSIFILQNELARQTRPISDDSVRKIRRDFSNSSGEKK